MITALPRVAIVLRDFDAALRTFRDGFGMPVLDFSDRTVPQLGAHVGMCMPEGGSNIELMAPADPDLPLSQSLQRTLDRRGEGPYAMMLEAPEPDAEAVDLAARGLDVLPLMRGAGGRDVHPRSTHGVLIRVYPDGSVRNPGGLVNGEPGLSGITRVVVATTDASIAADVYGRGLGLAMGPAVEDAEHGVLRASGRAPLGGDVELVSAQDTAKPFAAEVEWFVKDRHEGMCALVLQAADPAAALRTLTARGVAADGPGAVTAFGTRFLVEARA